MGDWLHCNNCFLQPGNGTGFVLTNCGHIYCVPCVKTSCTEVCKMCGSLCSTTSLSGQLKPQVDVYFNNPLELCKSSLSQIKTLFQVIEFQQSHRRRFMTHLTNKIQKMNTLMDTANKQKQDLENENGKLKEENMYLKRLLSEKGQSHGLGNRGVNQGRVRSSPTFMRASPQLSPRDMIIGSAGTSPVHRNTTSAYYNVTKSCPSRLLRGSSAMSTGRLSVITPPQNGRMGHIPHSKTPKSAPHPICLASPSSP